MTETLARQRNKRGEGAKLREEILAGAADIIEETGSEDAVTLRAVARRIGISAPSIYEHFSDRESIVETVVDDAFAELYSTIELAYRGAPDPVGAIRAGSLAYIAFAEQRPNRYRLLFTRHHFVRGIDGGLSLEASRMAPFNLLVSALQACVDAGSSSSTDTFADAVAVLTALHGYASLRPSIPRFPWPETDDTVDRILYGLGHITSPGRPRARTRARAGSEIARPATSRRRPTPDR